MFRRTAYVTCAGFLLMAASCSKHPTSGAPATPVSEYAAFWGTWQAAYLSPPETGKYKLVMNRDTAFSFSQIEDSTGAVSNQDSGTYHIDTASKIIRLVTAVHEGDYNYSGDTIMMLLTRVSGYDYMNPLNPSILTWEFHKQ
jgi:hypothetical protein